MSPFVYLVFKSLSRWQTVSSTIPIPSGRRWEGNQRDGAWDVEKDPEVAFPAVDLGQNNGGDGFPYPY